MLNRRIIRIMVVDDQDLFCKALATLLSSEADFQVVGSAQNGEEAVRQAVNLRPDVILMDLRMPLMDGVVATRRLHALLPNVRVIVLTTFDEDEDIYLALKAGAMGYLLKDVSSDELNQAIRIAAKGEYILTPSITARVVTEFTKQNRVKRSENESLSDPLSARELEILGLVAQGNSNKEIADTLVISEGTVKNHLSRILDKLEVKDRLQAVLRARELGII
jgi:DNA-binding NarL/FixJ family response regulator